MRLSILLSIMVLDLVAPSANASESAISLTDISSYYDQDLPSGLQSQVAVEVQSQQFVKKVVEAIGGDSKLAVTLSFSVKITNEQGMGMVAIHASVKGLPLQNSDRFLAMVEKYARCRVRGYSETYALVATFTPPQKQSKKTSDAVAALIKEYPLLAPQLLQPLPENAKGDYQRESFVIKDADFWWIYEISRDALGMIKSVNETRRLNPDKVRPLN